MPPILEIKNLSKHFGGLKAVDNCNFEVQRNSITGLIGPNGAGKTTTFDLITGFLEKTSGKIIFKDQEISNLSPYKRAQKGIGRTFQLIRLFPELTVMNNILVVLETNDQSLKRCFFGKKTNMHAKAIEYLKRVNLEEHAHSYAKNISYGQQKLLEIIRAAAMGSELLLLDEPAAGVNPTMLKKIENLILELKNEGRTIMIVEHNMPFIMGMSEEIIVMDQGSVLTIGTPEEVQKNSEVLEAYLGKGTCDIKTCDN